MGILIGVGEELDVDREDAAGTGDVTGVLGVHGDGSLQAVVLLALLAGAGAGAHTHDGGWGAENKQPESCHPLRHHAKIESPSSRSCADDTGDGA